MRGNPGCGQLPSMPPVAFVDLDHILTHTRELWSEMRGIRLFLTGGTGFFGCWLVESFLWANDRLGLNASATVLTRDPESFARKAPHLAGHPALRLLRGDVRNFEFPDGQFPILIHAATEASASLARLEPLAMLDTIITGTRRTLEFACRCGTRKFLLTSSGAVYGKQPPNVAHVSEDYPGCPDPLNAASVYGEGKRAAELLCALYASEYGLGCKVARCFAFVGPYLPLDTHFAIGNFIRDAMAGGPIRVRGDGTPYRSYLYAADLAVWLWTVLLRGEALRPYNVGSEDAISIGELARAVASALGSDIEVLADQTPVPGAPADRYVPSTHRARNELRLKQTVDLQAAIRRTALWYSQCQAEASAA